MKEIIPYGCDEVWVMCRAEGMIGEVPSEREGMCLCLMHLNSREYKQFPKINVFGLE